MFYHIFELHRRDVTSTTCDSLWPHLCTHTAEVGSTGVYSTSCWLGDLLSGTDPQNRFFWDPKTSSLPIQWDLLGQFPMEILEGASSTHATIRSYLGMKCRYQHVGFKKKYIKYLNLTNGLPHEYHSRTSKRAKLVNSKTTIRATRKVLWPSTTSVKNIQKWYMFLHCICTFLYLSQYVNHQQWIQWILLLCIASYCCNILLITYILISWIDQFACYYLLVYVCVIVIFLKC